MDLYLDILSIKSLGTNSSRSQIPCPCCLLQERGSSLLQLLFRLLVFSRKMAKASISLRSLNETLNRSLRGCVSTVLWDREGPGV